MNELALRRAAAGDLAALSQLIAGQNQSPATQCIHSETGGSEQALYDEMAGLYHAGELCFVLACDGDRLVGALGSEVDEGAGRGWLRGPFVLPAPATRTGVAKAQAWEVTATALLDTLTGCLPPAVRRLDSFLNAANERGNAFYLARGFRPMGLVHVYSVPAPAGAGHYAAAAEPLKPDLAPSFAALHDATFPTTWITGQGIVSKIGSDYHAFVHAREGPRPGGQGQVVGYVVVSLELGSGEGMVEFLGVRTDARRQGIGRGLLETALGWFFEVKGVPRVNLVVADAQVNARSLYESVGFALRYTGAHTRKDW